MRGRFLTTAIAVLLAAGLGYWYYRDSKQPDSSEKPKEKVFTFDKAKVKEVSLAPKQGEAVRAVKEGGAWKLAAPFLAPADPGEVEGLVSSLSTLEIQEVVTASPGPLADFGLDTPSLSVGVSVEGAAEGPKLLIGSKTPDGTGIYAKTSSQPRIFTIPAYLEGTFNKKPFDLRDRDLLHVKRDDVKSLEVAGGKEAYTLARGDRDEWSLTKPLETQAGRWAVDGLIGTLENLRMESVAADDAAPADLKRFGLDKPAWTVTLGLGSGEHKTLQIGGSPSEKKFYAREASGKLVAVVPGAVVDDLGKGMKNLRAQRLAEVATYEVTGFDIEADGAKRTYVRSSSKDKEGIDVYSWKRTAPDTKDLDTNAVQDALFKVGGVEVKDFIDAPGSLPSYGLDTPALRLTLRYGEGKQPASVEIGQKDGKSYGRRAGDKAVLVLDPAKADELIKGLKGL
jgi:hypothetical protein